MRAVFTVSQVVYGNAIELGG